jgi:exodeoxyribonuclease III
LEWPHPNGIQRHKIRRFGPYENRHLERQLPDRAAAAGADWLAAQPQDAPVDVLALQELKLTDDKFPAAAFQEVGYHAQWFGQKTYNGVALISRQSATDVVKNIPGFEDDMARVITATIAGVRVIGAYFPTARRRARTSLPTRCAGWTRCANGCAPSWRPTPRLVLLGDYNITFDDLDVWDPVGLAGTIHCTDEERAHLRALVGLGLSGFVPPVPAAREELQLVGLPHAGFPEEPRHAHRPHPGQRIAEAAGARLHGGPGAAQEPAAQRPRAGDRDAGPAGLTSGLIAAHGHSALGSA